VDYIPGVSTIRIVDLPTVMYGNELKVLNRNLECVSLVSKAQYLLFTSAHELETEVIDTLKAELSLSVYPIGPAIPYFELQKNFSVTNGHNGVNYFKWLDCQPISSVLYVSLGSFLSVSSAQMDEIASGLRDSGVKYLWVSRGETYQLGDAGGSDMSLVLPWCDQLKVLCHPSVGGFWTHCGWNSILEAAFASVPMLTFPIWGDQTLNSKLVVEDWKVGWRVKKYVGSEKLVTRGEISELVKKFMDRESNEGNEMKKRAKQLQKACRGAIADGGSSETNLEAFIRDISKCHDY
jgi:UDP:flavonoid glycosyltransferase YjiC (YdhE family)